MDPNGRGGEWVRPTELTWGQGTLFLSLTMHRLCWGLFRTAPLGEAECSSGREGVGTIGLQMGKLRLQVLRECTRALRAGEHTAAPGVRLRPQGLHVRSTDRMSSGCARTGFGSLEGTVPEGLGSSREMCRGRPQPFPCCSLAVCGFFRHL